MRRTATTIAACSSRGAGQALPGLARASSSRRRPCARSTACRSRSHAGRTLAVVGESGCGKSTLARQVTMLEPPTAGELRIDGVDVAERRRGDAQARCAARCRWCSRTRSPASIRARRSARRSRSRWRSTPTLSPAERAERGRAMLARVGLRPEHDARYPHMFSGGQRQRIAIARALMLEPQRRRRRRAGVGARRLDPGAGAQPADGPAGRDRRRLRLHLAQPRGGRADRRRGAGDVPRPGHGARAEGRALRRAAPSLHPRAARQHAARRRRPRRGGAGAGGAHRALGRAAVAAGAAVGLRLSHPLPARGRRCAEVVPPLEAVGRGARGGLHPPDEI